MLGCEGAKFCHLTEPSWRVACSKDETDWKDEKPFKYKSVSAANVRMISDSTEGSNQIVFVCHYVVEGEGYTKVEDSDENTKECCLVEDFRAVILDGDVFVESSGVFWMEKGGWVVLLTAFDLSSFLTNCPTYCCEEKTVYEAEYPAWESDCVGFLDVCCYFAVDVVVVWVCCLVVVVEVSAKHVFTIAGVSSFMGDSMVVEIS